MPKVSVGLFTEKNARFIRNVRSGLVKNGKESKDLTTRTGRCVKTVQALRPCSLSTSTRKN